MTGPGDQTQAKLLAEARSLYLRDGPAALSLRDVARRAGVSPAAVYRHFADKDALLRAVCEAGFRVFGQYLVEALAARTPRARLAATADGYLRFALDRPQDYRVLFMGALDSPGRRDRDRPAGAPHETFQFLIDRVAECQRAGIVRRGDPARVALGIWAHVHGLVSLRLTGHLADVGDDQEFAALYHQSVDHLVAGLAPAKETR